MLTGFMGTGKSEVGRRLAERFGRPFLDTDEMVERRAGKTIASIFAEDGEEAFRALERASIAEATGSKGAVIALGGGAVLDSGNVACLRAAGELVCLTARPETILDRVGDVAARPLLAGCDPRAVIIRLLDERHAAYEAAADLTVDTSDRSVDEVVEEIRRNVVAVGCGGRWKSST